LHAAQEATQKSLDAFVKWLVVEVVIPLSFVLALFWPIGWLALSLPHLFEKIFSSADLLPLSALILLGIFSDFEQAALYERIRSPWLTALRYCAILLAVLYLFTYGFCKVRYLEYQFPSPAEAVSDQITWLAIFSLGAAFFAVGMAIALKVKLTKERLHPRPRP